MTAIGQQVLRWCDAWNRNHRWDHNAHYHRRILRQPPAHADRGLDVGCDTGELARRVAPHVRQLDGLDVDDAVIATARRLTPDSLSIQYAQGDLLTADLRRRYGAITAVAVLHRMPLEPALQRLRDLLAPGGTLVVLGVYRQLTPTDHLISTAALPANLLMGAVKTRGHTAAKPVAMTARTASTSTSLA